MAWAKAPGPPKTESIFSVAVRKVEMKVYKNVGVYVLCRIGKHADAEIYRNSAKDNYHKPNDEIWENTVVYTDDVELGKVAERENLRRLINDALYGKIDRIYIPNAWDFWHNPQELFNTVRTFNSMSNPINISFDCRRRNPPVRANTTEDTGILTVLQEILEIQRIENTFMFIAANATCLSEQIKCDLLSWFITPEMLSDYLFDFHIVARDMEWEDLQKEIDLSEQDIHSLEERWTPSRDGVIKILNWSENQFLQYYLA